MTTPFSRFPHAPGRWVRGRSRSAFSQLLALALLTAGASAGTPEVPYDPERMAGDLALLASPAMEGRRSGEAGGDRAAAFLAGEMQRLGLEPAGEGGTFLEPFPVVLGTRLGDANALSVDGLAEELAVGEDFAPFPYSSDGAVAGEVVFAGFGIVAPGLDHDSYGDVDVKDRVVLVVDGEPREADPDSPFRSPEAFRYREVRHKAVTARDRGARALLVVSHPDRARGGLLTTGEGVAGSRAGLPVVSVSREVAAALLRGSGATLAERVRAIDRALEPAPALLEGTRVQLEVGIEEIRSVGYNVVGKVAGRDRGAGAVVVGAHYDHLGRGGEGSLAPDAGRAVHHGADDNASGTVALLAQARDLLRRPARRDVYLAAFGGEEMGLLGSRHFVEQDPARMERVQAMVNMDMIGRMGGDREVLVHGVDTGEGLRALVDDELTRRGASGSYSGDGYGPSDHTSFYAAGVPVLFFFTGPHQDYHRPSDTAEKVDPARLAFVARVVGRVVRRLADLDAPMEVVRAAAAPPRHGRGSGGGYGPFFGSIPDFREHEGGVLLSGVREGSPAQKAGVRAGDVLVRFGGRPLENLYDFTYALRAFRPGDAVEVVVVRDDVRQPPLRAVLEARR